jgi:ubiquitin-activating enzyme E1
MSSMDLDAAPGAEKIDEDLHSRQLAVYGRGAMAKMMAADILICGAGGLGQEVAKNVILAGVHSVTIHDQQAVRLADLGAAFYFTEADVGQNKADACREKLQELNTAVDVVSSTCDLTPDFLGRFQVRHSDPRI